MISVWVMLIVVGATGPDGMTNITGTTRAFKSEAGCKENAAKMEVNLKSAYNMVHVECERQPLEK